MAVPLPEPAVAVALASVAVHAQEAVEEGGHVLDLAAIEGILGQPNVAAYMAQLGELGLLPIRRDAS